MTPFASHVDLGRGLYTRLRELYDMWYELTELEPVEWAQDSI